MARKRHDSRTAAQARPTMSPYHMPRGPRSSAKAHSRPVGKPTTQYDRSVMSMGTRVSLRPRRAPTAETCTPSKSWKRSEEHTSELQSRENLVCRLLLEKKKKKKQ